MILKMIDGTEIEGVLVSQTDIVARFAEGFTIGGKYTEEEMEDATYVIPWTSVLYIK